MSSARRRKENRERSNGATLRVEPLEPRVLLSAYLFVDFGDRFPGGTLATTQGAFRDVANDAVPGNRILGTTLDDGASGFNAATPLNIVAQTFTATERAQMMAVVRRDYLPMDVIVVELTANVQTTADGRNVAGAASMADVINTLRAGDPNSKDEYVFVATFNVDPGGPNPATYGPGGGGNSPGGPRGTILDTVDLSSASNAHDDVVAVYSGGGLSNNTLNNISHEAGHGFGLQHSITSTPATASIDLFHQAEIMSYRNTNATTSSIAFTRYPMIRGDGNTPTAGVDPVNYNDLAARNGQVTLYDQLRLDPNVGANPIYNFVSGTGAFDIITIARNGNNADVSVQAFADAAYTTPITVPGLGGTTYSFSFVLDKAVLVYTGGSNDQIIVDGDLGVNVQIDGMLGTDTLIVNGKGAAYAVYTPNATSPVGVDLAGGVGVTSFGGTVSIGGSSILFGDFEIAGSVTIQNVNTVTYLTPPAGADHLTVNLTGVGTPQVTGTVNDVTSVVPLLLQSVGRLAVDTGVANDSLTVDSSNGLVVLTNGIDFDGGAGFDALLLTQTGGPTRTSSRVNVGALPGSGQSIIDSQIVNFQNIEPITDAVPAVTFSITSIPGLASLLQANNAINYTESQILVGGGRVTVDNFEPIEFANKATLVIDAGAGGDEINLNNPNTPTGLTSITVNGGDGNGDKLIVNGEDGVSDTLLITPTSLGAGTVAIPGADATYAGIEAIDVELQGEDNDFISLEGTANDDLFQVYSGPAPGSGVIRGFVNGVFDAGFALPEVRFNGKYINTSVILNSVGGGSDRLQFFGTDASDRFNIGLGSGRVDVVHIAASGGAANPCVNRFVFANLAAAFIEGLDGDDTFNITPGSTPITINGGNPASGSDVLFLTGAAATVESVTIQPSAANPTEQDITGLGGTITASGVELIRYTGADGDDTLTVIPGQADDRVRVESGSAVATDRVVSNALPNIEFSGLDTFVLDLRGGVDVATFATFSLGGAVLSNYEVLAGTADLLVIEGINGTALGLDDSFLVTNPGAGAAFAVTDQNATNGAVTVTATTFNSRPGRLQINTLGGDDTVTVDVNGPASDVIGVPITFDGGAGLDSLTVTGTPTTAVANVIQTPGTSPGDGRLLYTDAGGATLMTIDYANLEPVTDLVVATTLTVNGTNAANLIDYTQGSLATRGLVVVDANESLEFANKTTLVLDGLGGNDEIHIDNASTPTSLTGITVNGGGAQGVDTLIVDGTLGVDSFTLTATGAAAGTVALNAEPLVTFGTIGAVTLRGKEGADTFTPTGAVVLAGTATLDGGQGDDTFAIGAYLGKLKLLGDDGSDTASFAASTVAVTIDLDLLNNPQKANNVGLNVTLADAIENFIGSDFNDKITIDALEVTRTIDGSDPTKVTPPVIPPGDLLTVDGQSQFVTVDRIDPITGQPLKDSGTATAFSYQPITFADIEKLAIVNTLGSTGFGGSTLPAYTPAVNYDVPVNVVKANGPKAIASGNLDPANPDTDFTSNPWPDLVTVNALGAAFASVQLNRGDGTFAPAVTYATGLNYAVSVKLDNVDGDGALDIIAVGLFQKKITLSVLLGNDDGTFGAFTLTQTTLKNAPTSLAVGDIDGVNGPDLIVANTKKIAILLNNGAGVFTEQPAAFTTGKNIRDIRLADLDHDNQLDMLVAGYAANKVGIFLNTGGGTFGVPTHFAAGTTPNSIVVGDFDTDGHFDFAVSNAQKTGLSVLLGQGDGTFAAQPQAQGYSPWNHAIAAGDVNSDGKLDLIVMRDRNAHASVPSLPHEAVAILLGVGNGTFSAPYDIRVHDTELRQPSALAVADFNQDGGLDFAVANVGSGDVSLLLKNTVI